MKHLIYIDANLYLRFFDTSSSDYKKLLKSIEEVKDKIFITKQIENEVLRNKLTVFSTTFNQYAKQFEIQKVNLPEHLEGGENNELKIWNIQKEEIISMVDKQRKSLLEITSKFMEAISTGKDHVSITLSKVFLNSILETEDQLFKARTRKELGNPPGKKADPLGDQLSWEQLLDNLSLVDGLWIITNDKDYFTEFNKKCYLNSFLYKDIYSRKKNIDVYCFNTLSEGLKSYSSITARKIQSLPPENILENIIVEEKKSNELSDFINRSLNSKNEIFSIGTNTTGSIDPFSALAVERLIKSSFNFPSDSFKLFNKPLDLSNPIHCPKCGSTNLIEPKNYKNNPIYTCKNCGKKFKHE